MEEIKPVINLLNKLAVKIGKLQDSKEKTDLLESVMAMGSTLSDMQGPGEYCLYPLFNNEPYLNLGDCPLDIKCPL